MRMFAKEVVPAPSELPTFEPLVSAAAVIALCSCLHLTYGFRIRAENECLL
jgi:hypothetical protein